MTTNIRRLDLDDPGDQKLLAGLQRQRESSARLYLVGDAPPGRPDTTGEDILDPQTSTKATADHLGRLMIDRRVTALHCDPHPDRVWVRARIDGRLERLGSLPPANYHDLVDYLKVRAGFELEPDICQTGPADWPVGRRTLAGQLLIAPAVDGPKLVFQSQPSEPPPDLGAIGFWGRGRRQLEQALGRRRGLVLITGDDWAGRRLALESAEALLLADQRLSLASLTGQPGRRHPYQTLVQPAWGQTRSRWLKAQADGDADVLVVDQLLDRRSCQLAVEAAASRRLVLTTIGGRSAAEAAGSLLASRLEPHLLAAARPAVVTVRAVRRLKSRPRPERKTKLNWAKASFWAEFGLDQPDKIAALVDQAALAATEIGGQLAPPPAKPPAEADYQGQMLLTAVETNPRLTGLPPAGTAEAGDSQAGLRDDGLVKICLGLTSPEEVRQALSGRRTPAGRA